MDLSDVARFGSAAQKQIMSQMAESVVKSKYHSKKTKIGNLSFPSKKEADRFLVLLLKQRAGMIRNLKIQPEFTLQEAFTTPEGEKIRAIRYLADYSYEEKQYAQCGGYDSTDASGYEWVFIVEDVKSPATRTRVYLNKRKMMIEKFGITIREV